MSEDPITGTIPGVHGYTVAELAHIWQAMVANPEAWGPRETRLACMAVGLVNQIQPLRDALAHEIDAVLGMDQP